MCKYTGFQLNSHSDATLPGRYPVEKGVDDTVHSGYGGIIETFFKVQILEWNEFMDNERLCWKFV